MPGVKAIVVFLLGPLSLALCTVLYAGVAKLSVLVFRRIFLPWNKAVKFGVVLTCSQIIGIFLSMGGVFAAVAGPMLIPPLGGALYLSRKTRTSSGEPVSFGLGLLHSCLCYVFSNFVIVIVVLLLGPPHFTGGG